MIIGITGRIATGKSTLAGVFSEMGFLLIDADEIYHNLLETSDEMKNEILNRFGTLDRRNLFKRIKDDENSLSELNEITHKYVLSEINQIIAKNDGSDIVMDVPIPVEHGFLDISDEVIVTTCSRDTQISRLVERDGISKSKAAAKIAIQLTSDYYESLGGTVVNTECMDMGDLRIFASGFIGNFG
ncbi:MAG: dephospho-CoA kinase [Clostridia bacterium]|nr:dephospho-CoA kinase [Clostridia bacterium]